MSEGKVKRFVVMAGAKYYASGGFRDYIGSFDTEAEAQTRQDEYFKEGEEYRWSHIVDLETGMMKGKGKGYNPFDFI